ncbi:MAG: hypothetical protein IT531_11180 [Burkholderiales bacterium]|nr:hypothetical protein [Burkholderiales bacterium]
MRRFAACLAAIAAFGTYAYGAESYTFDASQFEKKPFELGGYLELKGDHFALNRGAAFYQLNFAGIAPRETLDRSTATLKLTGKARAGDWLLTARSHSESVHDQLAHASESRFDELVASWKPTPGFTLDAGKTVLKWGKGYAWNPVGFVERMKDPNDPELAREGFTVLAADIVRSFAGALRTLAFTPLLLPVNSDVNDDYGRHGHLNVAAKLYLLYRDTDIDFYFLNHGSRSRRFGMDFSRNIGTNFEVHGEWARIEAQEFALLDTAGALTRRTQAATSWLLGLRYLSERETTYIVEYYRNGAGFSADQYRAFTALVQRALQAGTQSPLYQRVQTLAPSYGRQNPLRDYLYLRVSQKEPCDILYVTPSLTAMVNVDDKSYSISPEILYTGRNNLELRARAVFLGGGRGTDFGEKQNERRVELLARIYF